MRRRVVGVACSLAFLSLAATAALANPFMGTRNDDVLYGTSAADTFRGLSGNVTL